MTGPTNISSNSSGGVTPPLGNTGPEVNPLGNLPPPSVINQTPSTWDSLTTHGGEALQSIGRFFTEGGALEGVSRVTKSLLIASGILTGGALKYGLGISLGVVCAAINFLSGEKASDGAKIGIALAACFGAGITGVFLALADVLPKGGDSQFNQGFEQALKGMEQYFHAVTMSIHKLDYEEVMNKPWPEFFKLDLLSTAFRTKGPEPDVLDQMKALYNRIADSEHEGGISGRIDDLLQFKRMKSQIESGKAAEIEKYKEAPGYEILEKKYAGYKKDIGNLPLGREILAGVSSKGLEKLEQTASLVRISRAMGTASKESKALKPEHKSMFDKYEKIEKKGMSHLEKLSPSEARDFLAHIGRKKGKTRAEEVCINSLKEHLRYFSDKSNPLPEAPNNLSFFRVVDDLLKSFVAKEIEKELC